MACQFELLFPEYGSNSFMLLIFLIINQNVRVLKFSFHFISIGNEVRRKVTTVELHTFYYFYCSFSSFCFFNSDNTFFTYFSIASAISFTDSIIVISRDRSNLLDFFIIVTYFFRLFLQIFNNSCQQLCRYHVSNPLD